MVVRQVGVATRQMKKQQQRIQNILDSKKILYTLVDISVSSDIKEEMRAKVKDPKALPPQIFNGDSYCGDFEAFENAVESENLDNFLNLKNQK